MKRFTICVVLLGFIAVSLLIARPGLTDQQSEKKNAEPTKLEQLQKERIEALEEAVPVMPEEYQMRRVTITDFSVTQKELIEAKLDATDKPDERIAFLEKQLKIAQDFLAYVEKERDVGTITKYPYLRAKAHCLNIEIKLLKEKAEKNRTP